LRAGNGLKRILVFQTAYLGDLVLATPLVRSLKASFPGAEIFLVVRKGYERLLDNSPCVFRVLPFDKRSVVRFGRFLAGFGFELAVSPHRSHRTSMTLWLSRTPRRIGFDTAGFSFLYTDRVPYKMEKGVHEVDRNLSLLKPLEEDFPIVYLEEPKLWVPDPEVRAVLEKFCVKRPYIAIAPGSVWETKAWLPEYFARVALHFLKAGFTVVLVGSKRDVSRCNTVEAGAGSVVNLCGLTDLREFLSLIKGASLVVSNDSSPVHIATALGVPVVEIYGSTVPAFGFFPYKNGVWVEVNGLYCRPCGVHGRRKCPEGHLRCMVELKPEAVIRSAEELLNKHSF